MLSPAPPSLRSQQARTCTSLQHTTNIRINEFRSIAHSTRTSTVNRGPQTSSLAKVGLRSFPTWCSATVFSVHHTSRSILGPVFGRYRSPSLLLRTLLSLFYTLALLQHEDTCMNCRPQVAPVAHSGGACNGGKMTLYRKFAQKNMGGGV